MCIHDTASHIDSGFADKRRSWQLFQLGLLYTIDRPWIILHAELSSWCLERVSTFSLKNLPQFFRPRRNNSRSGDRASAIPENCKWSSELLQNQFLSSSGNFLMKERVSNGGRLIGKRKTSGSSQLRSVPI